MIDDDDENGELYDIFSKQNNKSMQTLAFINIPMWKIMRSNE